MLQRYIVPFIHFSLKFTFLLGLPKFKPIAFTSQQQSSAKLNPVTIETEPHACLESFSWSRWLVAWITCAQCMMTTAMHNMAAKRELIGHATLIYKAYNVSFLLDMHTMANWHPSKQAIHWPVPCDHITGLSFELIKVMCFLKLTTGPKIWIWRKFPTWRYAATLISHWTTQPGAPL